MRRWALRERDVLAELIMSNDIIQSLHLLPDSGVAEHIGSILRVNMTITELTIENAFPIDENTGEWLGVRELSRALRLPAVPRACKSKAPWQCPECLATELLTRPSQPQCL